MSLKDKLKGKSNAEILNALGRSRKSAYLIYKSSIKYNFNKGIELALEKGAAKSPSIMSYCVREGKGNLEEVKRLVDAGVVIDAKNNKAFCEAIYKKHVEIISFLIDKGVDVNFPDGEPLLTALKRGNKEIIDLLIENGAKYNRINKRRFNRALPFFNNDIKNRLRDDGIV